MQPCDIHGDMAQGISQQPNDAPDCMKQHVRAQQINGHHAPTSAQQRALDHVRKRRHRCIEDRRGPGISRTREHAKVRVIGLRHWRMSA
jgi:hypothetical protein